MLTSRNRALEFLLVAAVLGAPSLASAQEGEPVRRRPPVREPIIDLEKQAGQRRPGQVMPGDGVPDYEPPAETPKPVVEEPAPEPAEPSAAQPAQPVIEPAPAAAEPAVQAPPSVWVTVPVELELRSLSAVGRMVQWRAVDSGDVGVWEDPLEGARLETGAEIRTGLGAETVVEVAGWQVTIDRLTKAAILGAENTEDGSRRVEVHLERGQIRAVASPGTEVSLVVITSDGVVPMDAGITQVSQDAFRGTRAR